MFKENTPETDKIKFLQAKRIFLAGSIEMGKCDNWQKILISKLNESEQDFNLIIDNPRNDNWDSSWVQEEKQLNFNHQVNQELNKLEESDIIFMNFEPNTKSPISLLEFGLYANSGKMIVRCPREFYRYGNVSLVCTRFSIPIFNNMDDAIGALVTKINKL